MKKAFLFILILGINLYVGGLLFGKTFFLLPPSAETLGALGQRDEIYRSDIAELFDRKPCESRWCRDEKKETRKKNKNLDFVHLRPKVIDQAEFLAFEPDFSAFVLDQSFWIQDFLQDEAGSSIHAGLSFLEGDHALSLDIVDRIFRKRQADFLYKEMALSWDRQAFQGEVWVDPPRVWKGADSVKTALSALSVAELTSDFEIIFVQKEDWASPLYQNLKTFCKLQASADVWLLIMGETCQIETAESLAKKPSREANVYDQGRAIWGAELFDDFIYGSPHLRWEQGLSEHRVHAMMIYDDGLVKRTLLYAEKSP